MEWSFLPWIDNEFHDAIVNDILELFNNTLVLRIEYGFLDAFVVKNDILELLNNSLVLHQNQSFIWKISQLL